MNNQLVDGKGTPVSTDDETSFDIAVFDTAVRHSFESLDKLLMRLHRYPPDAVTVAMGTYFQELLGALFDEGVCTADDVRAFLRDIESGILEPKECSTENNAVPVSSGAPQSNAGKEQTEQMSTRSDSGSSVKAGVIASATRPTKSPR